MALTSKEIRAAGRSLDAKWRAAKRIVAAEAKINRMRQARELREAAITFADALRGPVIDSADTTSREANRALLDAAVHFVRALRGEE
jgi:hypothetical protein